MSIAKRLSPRRALTLLAAAMLLAALPRPGAVLAGAPEEGAAAGQAAGDASGLAVLELDARDEDAARSAGENKDLSALLAEAGPDSKELRLAVEELNEAEADVEEKAVEKETEAVEREDGSAARLEKEAERDEKEIEAVEKDSEDDSAPGEDDKGDKIERQDPGLDD